MPFPVGDLGNIHKKVHSRAIFERRFLELNLDGLSRVTNNFSNVGWKTGAIFAIDTLKQIEAIGNEDILVRVVGFTFTSCEVMHEAPIAVPQHDVHENETKVVSVPEGFEALVPHVNLGGGIH